MYFEVSEIMSSRCVELLQLRMRIERVQKLPCSVLIDFHKSFVVRPVTHHWRPHHMLNILLQCLVNSSTTLLTPGAQDDARPLVVTSAV